MKIKYLIPLLFLIAIPSCKQKVHNKETSQKDYSYGTQNDSALFHHNKGWEYIMDYGQWTLSEKAFRKAVAFDSTFVIGKSLVGKITGDLNERIRLLNEINLEKSKASRDDQLLLEVTLATIELFNSRDQNQKLEPDFYSNFKKIAENNYRDFIHKHPNESYIKAEYIEVLQSNYGSKIALDSLHLLTTSKQKEIPFFISYAATLESDLGNYKKALLIADAFKTKINNTNIPQPYVLYASIYLKMGSLSVAKAQIEKALKLDPKHVFAQRFKNEIDRKLNSSHDEL
jgi:tetratricopeptide (TPR) repeat protein